MALASRDREKEEGERSRQAKKDLHPPLLFSIVRFGLEFMSQRILLSWFLRSKSQVVKTG